MILRVACSVGRCSHVVLIHPDGSLDLLASTIMLVDRQFVSSRPFDTQQSAQNGQAGWMPMVQQQSVSVTLRRSRLLCDHVLEREAQPARVRTGVIVEKA